MASKKYFNLYCVLHSSSDENWFALSKNTVLTSKFPIDFHSTLLSFSKNSSKLCCIDTTFSRMCRTFKRRLSTVHIGRYIYLLWAIIEGMLLIVYQINTLLWYKITCSESRNFDSQWTLVSFLVKHNQFYREAKLTCPLYRPTEDICIRIYVFKRVLTCGTYIEKSVSMHQHFEQVVGKQRRQKTEGKYLGFSEAEPL